MQGIYVLNENHESLTMWSAKGNSPKFVLDLQYSWQETSFNQFVDNVLTDRMIKLLYICQ